MTELTKTREQLVTMALDNLQVTENGQAPDDDDYNKVDERLDGLLENLRIRDVCSVMDDTQIPAEMCADIALLLADQAAPAFGRQSSGEAAIRLIEDRLIVIARKKNTPDWRLRVDPFLRNTGPFSYSRWSSGR